MTQENQFVSSMGRVSRFLGLIASASVLAIVVLIAADLIVRSISGKSVGGVFELTEILLSVSVFLGLAAVQEGKSGHISISLVVDRLPSRFSRRVRLIAAWLVLFLLVMMSWAMVGAAAQSISDSETRWGLLAVPLWPGRVIVAIGVIAFAGQVVVSIFARRALIDQEARSVLDQSH